MERVAAGAEIHVGQAKTPLPEPVELALRDVVQARADVAFAYVPVIAFGSAQSGSAQSGSAQPSQVLVVFLRAGSDPERVLGELSAAVKSAIDRLLADHPGLTVEPLAVMPISLGKPLDGLAQAVMITDTMLHVTDVTAWHRAKNPKPWFKRALDWLMGR